jgi:hypothetical protein
MTTEPAGTADQSTIARKILDVVAETARDHAAYGEKGTDLRDAPKHLLCVDIARGLARAFGSLRYHLQAAPDEPPPASRNDLAAASVVGKEVTIPRQSRGHSGCEPLEAAGRGR